MALVQRLLNVEILVEAEEDVINRTSNFIKTSVKGSCRNLNSGAVILALYDEDGRLVGLDITGAPSRQLQAKAETLFPEVEEEETATPAPPVVPPGPKPGPPPNRTGS